MEFVIAPVQEDKGKSGEIEGFFPKIFISD